MIRRHPLASLDRNRRGHADHSSADGLSSWGDDLAVVGHRYPRLEAAVKVTGAARYSCDVRLPNQLYAAVLRCPLPHARIKQIDAAAAAALPGVYAVLTYTNAPPMDWHRGKLFDRHLRFVGDEVAAVAAETRDLAEAALGLIEVDYEPLPFVLDIATALAAGAPSIHEGGNRAGAPVRYERGDVVRALAEADVVIEHVYTTQCALHNSLEPHGCTVRWEGETLTVWESTQAVYEIREALADKLDLSAHNVRVVAEHVGGGFGSKLVLWKHTVIAALLARAAGRPVQLVLDREAENLCVGNRNATRQQVKIAAKRDGSLTAISVKAAVAIGAYQVEGESSDVVGIFQRLYRCANVATEQTAFYTNTGPSASFRAPGYVEGAFALESAIDELAAALQTDPLELRLQNYANRDQKKNVPYSSPQGLRRCYEQATDVFGWHNRNEPKRADGKRRGIGLAAHEWGGGSGQPPAYAWVKLSNDGSAEIVTGSQDIGTGTRTGLAQIAAEELGLPLSRVTLRIGDTGCGPYAPASGGSATLATLGPAIRAAAADVKSQLLDAAAEIYELASPGRLYIDQGSVRMRGNSSFCAAVDEITQQLGPRMLLGQGERGLNPSDLSIRTFGVQCVEIEVDVETGELTVLRVAAAHDCGRIINPALVESQVAGGITQALGFALHEERVVDTQSGVVLNASLEDYKVPTIADVPVVIHAGRSDPDVEANNTGAKGIGEPPIIPTAAAIANALANAVGVRLRDTPLSRHSILNALHESQRPAELP